MMTGNSVPYTVNGAPAADRLRALLDSMPPDLAPPAADSPAGRIMAATRELFAEAGFAGVTVRAVSAHAGVNVAMINYYFGSKDRLMDAVLSQELQHLLRDVVVGLDNEASAEQVLAEFPLRLLDSLRRDPQRLRLMRLAVSTEPERLRRIIRSLGEHSVLGVSRVLADLVSEAQTGGRVVAMTAALGAPVPDGQCLRPGVHRADRARGRGLRPRRRRALERHRAHLARLLRQGLLASPDLKEGPLREVRITLLLGVLMAWPGHRRRLRSRATADTLRLDLDGCLARALETAPALQASAAAIDESQGRRGRSRGQAQAGRSAPRGIYQYASEHMTARTRDRVRPSPALAGVRRRARGDHQPRVAIPRLHGRRTVRARRRPRRPASRRRRAATEARGWIVTRAVRQAFSAALGPAGAGRGRPAGRRPAGPPPGGRDRRRGPAGAATEESRLRALARLRQAEQRRCRPRPRAIRRPGAGTPGRPARRRRAARRRRRPPRCCRPTTSPAARSTSGPTSPPSRWEEQRQRDCSPRRRAAGCWPRVGADLRAHYGRPGVDAMANDWMGYATAGVSLDWPLWDAGARSSARRPGRSARAAGSRPARATSARSSPRPHAGARMASTRPARRSSRPPSASTCTAHLLAMVEGPLRAAGATESEYLDAQDDLTAGRTRPGPGPHARAPGRERRCSGRWAAEPHDDMR